MKKREERDDAKVCDEAQTGVPSLACVRSKDNCEGDKTSRPHVRSGSSQKPFAGRMTHAKIALRESIIERHGKIVQEPQHSPFALRESIQQVACRALFGPASCSLLGRWRSGIGGVAFCEELVIATKEACQHQHIQFVLACSFGLLDLGFHLQEESFHLACPDLFEDFFHKG